MRIDTLLIAPNAFKGSLRAVECAHAMAAGARDADARIALILHPLSDGGDGLVEVLADALGASVVRTIVSGPLPGQRVVAAWAWHSGRHMAIIEMANAAGLGLVPEARRDPKLTTTRGVGELIREALDRGAASLIVGIGGSATNDGGAGMAQALGARLVDEWGNDLSPGGIHLRNLTRIDLSGLDRRLEHVSMTVACDVRNPLTGKTGASAVFAPQKGGTPEDVQRLDEALEHFGTLVSAACGRDILHVPGAGAAGGLGAGLLAFCHAELKSGIDVVLDATGFDEHLASADLVITGEGKIDAQTQFGKVPAGVLRRAQAVGKPVIAIAGIIEGERSRFIGADRFLDVLPLTDERTTREEAMRNAGLLVREKTKEIIRRLRE